MIKIKWLCNTVLQLRANVCISMKLTKNQMEIIIALLCNHK